MLKIDWSAAIRSHKFSVLFALLAVALFFAATIYFSDSYPAAVVNQGSISASRFEKNYASASMYYDNIMKTYRPEEGAEPIVKPSPLELKADVMTQLVESELVRKAVALEVGKDLEYLLENKLGKLRTDTELRKAAPALYGMEFADFWDEVLIPQAKRDILAGRLFLNGIDIDQWLIEAKKSASVVIFSEGLRWNGERVELDG